MTMLSGKAVLLPVILGVLLLGRNVAAADRGESWVEINAPNFRVISDAGEKRAEQLALQFETIRAVFRSALQVASEHPTEDPGSVACAVRGILACTHTPHRR
jgi:hypothetical protein